MHKTIEEVEADKKYRAVRAKAPNMHNNAESYACVTYFARISDK